MSHTRSKYEFREQASLSQQASDKETRLRKYVGADQAISDKLADIDSWIEEGFISEKDPRIRYMKRRLDNRRLARLATSERLNEITKLGFMLPKADNIISSFDEEEEE